MVSLCQHCCLQQKWAMRAAEEMLRDSDNEVQVEQTEKWKGVRVCRDVMRICCVWRTERGRGSQILV